MSARGLLTIAGQVAGSAIGGPVGAAIGGVIGGYIGGNIDGPQTAQGPRLSDLKVTAASYGTPIAYVEAHPRIGGTIIWSSDKREIATTTNEGGKGADTTTDVTTFSYEIDVLYLLSSSPIVGVTRVWSNGKLVYSALTEEAATASLAAESWAEMIAYSGDAGQLPDPTYEAAVGVGNAPAYRGRGTVMFRGLQLGGGGQMPNLTLEVSTAGTPGEPGFIEDFGGGLAQGLTLYSVLSGDMLPYSIGLFGALSIAARDNSPPDTIERSIPATTTNRVSFDFQIDGDEADDAGEVYLGNAVASVAWLPRREAATDALRRPYLFMPGVTYGPLGATALPLNEWLRAELHIVPGAGNSTFNVTRIADGANLLSYAPYAAHVPLLVDRIGFYRDAGGLTCPVSYDNITASPTAFVLEDEDLADVVSRLCLRAGLTAPQIDVTALAGIAVRGFAIGQVSTARQGLEILAAAYLFGAVESGGVLKFVRRGGSSIVTIPYADMDASSGDPGEPLPTTRRNDDEAPAQCIVRFANALDDGQDGAEASDRLVGFGTGVQVFEVPLTLSPTEARRLADVAIMDIAAAALSVGPVALTRDYAQIEPTDVVTLTDLDGSAYRVRVTRLTESGGMRSLEGVLDDASVVSSAAATSEAGYTYSTAIAVPADTVLHLLDIPLLRDADDAAGFYAAARGGTSPWPGARLLGSIDNLTYTERVTFTESAVIGICGAALGNFTGGNVFDWQNAITVSVGDGVLASDTRDNLFTLGANAALIGNDEIIQFLSATLVSSGVYTLTGLLRGRQGTEWAIGAHVADEPFVLLRLAGLRRVPNDTNEIGALRYYKGVTLGRALGTAATQSLSNTARCLKPWAPVDLRATRDGSANLTLTWSRRSRLQANFTNGNVPLGETSEAYEVDIYADGTYAVLKRTIGGLSAASASYSAAAQTTDFGAPQATVHARVYQLSATVGRGTALQGAA